MNNTADNTERIETLSCFSDHALSMMSNEGYRDDNDVLWTATREELDAVEAHREARYQEWLMKNPVAELETFTEAPGHFVTEATIRVFGGSSQPARVEAATDCLEGMCNGADEPYTLALDAYETTAKTSESGAAYVEFRYFGLAQF